MKFFVVFISVSFFAVSIFSMGCSLYQSSGREAIEKGLIPIEVASGLDTHFQTFYLCKKDYSTPAYLKVPLEVLEAPHLPKEYSVLLQDHKEPYWVLVYTHHNQEHYLSCQYHLHPEHFEHLNAIALKGFEKIEGLTRR